MTKKEKSQAGKIKYFLYASGFSAAGIVFGFVLHIAFYAIGMLLINFPVISLVMGILVAFFFLLAVVLCPLGLLVGLIGTLLMWRKL